MAWSKSHSGRHVRRGARRNARQEEELLQEEGGEPQREQEEDRGVAADPDAQESGAAAPAQPSALPAPQEPEQEKGDASVRSLIRSMPTPLRSRANTAPALCTERAATQIASAAELQSAPGSSRPRALGPEPWELQEQSASQPYQKGGYREYLQARGHQTMQRSLAMNGPASPHPAPLYSTGAFGASGLLAGLAPPQARSPLPLHQPLPQSLPWAAPPAPQSPGFQVQQALLHQPFQPQQGSGSVASVAFPAPPSPCRPGAASLVALPSGVEGGVAAYGLAPRVLLPVGSPMSREDLMATLMPSSTSLNKEQIAEQLRAMVPCNYDD